MMKPLLLVVMYLHWQVIILQLVLVALLHNLHQAVLGLQPLLLVIKHKLYMVEILVHMT